MLISCDISSLVIDDLCNQARGQDATVACFYFDFAVEKEQSPVANSSKRETNILRKSLVGEE